VRNAGAARVPQRGRQTTRRTDLPVPPTRQSGHYLAPMAFARWPVRWWGVRVGSMLGLFGLGALDAMPMPMPLRACFVVASVNAT
jgi:hypothetical protein